MTEHRKQYLIKYRKEYYKNHKEYYSKLYKQWCKNNLSRRRELSRNWYRKHYGVNKSDFKTVSIEILGERNEKMLLCQK